MEDKRKGGKKRRPGCRQVSLWSDAKGVRLIERAVKKASKRQGIELSRSKWLESVAIKCAREELANK